MKLEVEIFNKTAKIWIIRFCSAFECENNFTSRTAMGNAGGSNPPRTCTNNTSTLILARGLTTNLPN